MTRAADVGRAPRAFAPRATDEGSSAPAPVSWMKGKRTVDERSPIKGSTVRGLDKLERKLKGAPQKRINLSNPATIAEIVSKPQAEWSAATFVAMNIGTGTPPENIAGNFRLERTSGSGADYDAAGIGMAELVAP